MKYLDGVYDHPELFTDTQIEKREGGSFRCRKVNVFRVDGHLVTPRCAWTTREGLTYVGLQSELARSLGQHRESMELSALAACAA